jgi:hypothetical protein
VTSSEADPFGDATEPIRIAAKSAAPVTPNEWETTIIRGKESRTRTFPLPPTASGEPTAREEAGAADAAAAPKASAAPAAPAVVAEPIGAGAGG